MTKREEAAQLLEKLRDMAGDDPVALDVIQNMEEEYSLLYEDNPDDYEDGTDEGDSYDLEEAFLHYQTAVINYVQQVDMCLLKQLARERLAYDLFLCVADDSSISPNEKIIKQSIASELIEMIPKVGEYLEVASDIGSQIIDAKIKSSEVNVRYAATKNSIALIDISPDSENTQFSTTIQSYISFLLDKSILIGDATSSEEKDVYRFYISAATMVNNYTIALRDKKNTIQAFIPKNKNNYINELPGLLQKTDVATMFKTYLIDWLNQSGHYIEIYCNFTQRGMEYNIDYNSPKKSYIYEPSLLLKTEDAAVTNALVSLGLLSRSNAPITESKIRNFGLKVNINYPLDVDYRTN